MRVFAALLVLALVACSSEEQTGDPDSGVVAVRDAADIADSGTLPDAPSSSDRGVIVDEDSGAPPADAEVGEDAEPADLGMTGSIADLSDTFEGNALDPSWSFYRDETADVVVENGQLSIVMTNGVLWFNQGTGPLVYKMVTGNFKLTGRVHARKRSDPSQPVDQNIHLAGLMARDPMGAREGGAENYVFIVVGRDPNDVSVETKTTVDNVSTYEGPTWPATEADLRLCRVGSVFRLYKKEIGAQSWILAATFDRPDLPASLQVGANSYAGFNMGNFDMRGIFDELIFAEANSEADCTN